MFAQCLCGGKPWSRTAPGSSLHFYVHIDGSPQWRGLELLATSDDIHEGVSFARRLLPAVPLEREQLDTIGKTMSLLWQLWLLSGPSAAALRFGLSAAGSVAFDRTWAQKVRLPISWMSSWSLPG